MHPNLAQQQEMLQILMDAKPEGAEPILHSDMGWQYQHETYISTLAEQRLHPEHVTQRQLHRQWRHRTGLRTPQGRILPRPRLATFESFKADLDAYITHWNTTRRQVKLKGLTPAEYRDQALQEAA